MPATSAQALPTTTFGELLRHLRQRARMTQDELGIAVGYSRAHIARLENNQRLPDPSAVCARFFGPLDLKSDSPEAMQLVSLAAAVHDGGGAEETEPERQTPNNLPFPVTSFVGRTEALAELQCLLPTTRLLTLTGVGGTGKTRLALELAGRVLDDFPDGVWLVELAPVADPALVPATVLSVLSTPGHPDLTATDSVVNFLRARRVLLILDNCEHVIDAAAQLADAVGRTCGQVRMLATSREALNIAGELSWRVPSLSAPPATSNVMPEALARHEAVQLFVERAAFAQPGFAVTQANAAAIQQICARLDGIPLALELAAARIKTLSPDKIAERLSDRFRLLTGGSRTTLPRQQTLQALVDWSYRLLTEPEKTLLRRLSVFVGGWTLEAAEAVAAGDDIQPAEVLDQLARLVDKSLVVRDDTGVETRYGLLETIRQFALEKLADTVEGDSVRNRQLDYFLKLGLEVYPQLTGRAPTDQVKLLNQLMPDIDNIRSVCDWASATGRIEDGWNLMEAFERAFIPLGARMEACDRLVRLLKHSLAPGPSRRKAGLLTFAAAVQNRYGYFDDADQTIALVEEIGKLLNDTTIQTWAMAGKATQLLAHGDETATVQYADQWLAFAEEHNAYDQEGLNDLREVIAYETARISGDFERALVISKRQYAKLASLDEKISRSALERGLGYDLLRVGELEEANRAFTNSIVDNRDLGDHHAVAACLGAFAGLALAQGEVTRCARLLGASFAIQETVRLRLDWEDLREINRTLQRLGNRLDSHILNSEIATGRALTLEQAMAYALEGEPDREVKP